MIRTRIAQILSPTEVVLAAGEKQGVRPGMRFVIYELSDVITDPETGESLGQLELVKGNVIAAHVQDSITLATTPTRSLDEFLAYPLPRWATRREELSVDQAAVAVKADRTVRVGDLVRSVEAPAIQLDLTTSQ